MFNKAEINMRVLDKLPWPIRWPLLALIELTKWALIIALACGVTTAVYFLLKGLWFLLTWSPYATIVILGSLTLYSVLLVWGGSLDDR